MVLFRLGPYRQETWFKQQTAGNLFEKKTGYKRPKQIGFLRTFY